MVTPGPGSSPIPTIIPATGSPPARTGSAAPKGPVRSGTAHSRA